LEIPLLVTPLMLIVLATLIRVGKLSFLLSGYNIASRRERDKYDEKALCRFLSNLLFALGGILLAVAAARLSNLPGVKYISSAGSLLFSVTIIAALIYMNTGKRFIK
jgi:hypothetical protein